MTKYQFEVDGELWERWKETVPRSKSLDERIRELLAADADGRVLEAGDGREAAQGVQEAAGPVGDVLEVPGQGEVAEQRREAVRAVREHLREQGRVPKDELVAIGAEIAGDTYADEYSLWNNLLQPKLSELADIEPVGGSGDWRRVEK